MALTTTTLAGAITANRLQNLPLTSTAGFVVGQPVKIDQEYMVVTAITAAGISVRARGDQGTAAVAHDLLSPVVTGLAADFPPFVTGGGRAQVDSWQPDVVTLGQDVTLTIPVKNTTYLLMKAGVLNITLPSGTAAQAGITLTFISESAFAHVLTYSAGFLGSANTVATFAASVGASLMAQVGTAGKLAVLASQSITFTL